ncbi:MAG: tRNA pseudouridine(13) synthase TruD [Candidatus Diapherotrites archaeon]|nr:tRNA pseudouridine(13) synthase TruD [Candidatus Diapherotrites archaeon]
MAEMQENSTLWRFSTKSPGIGGKIKHRYADFIVEELHESYKCAVTIEDFGKPFLDKPDGVEKSYLWVELQKKNRDLHDAIRQLSRALHCSPRRIGYAGIKDKRAITCQRISIFKPNLDLIIGFGTNTILLKKALWAENQIDLGMLSGNAFTVTIRNIGLGEDEIKANVESCFREMKNGIANYFGAQRFGGIRNISHLVGKEIIKGNYENAVMIYLSTESEQESEAVREARRLAAKNDLRGALNSFPKKYRYERAMLHHLASHRGDYVGALRKLPKKIVFLFTHAYQAYLFNRILDRRLETNTCLKAINGEPHDNGVPLGLLPGFDSSFTAGAIGKIEREVLAEEDIDFSMFKVKKMPECSSAGARRKIVVVPEKLAVLEIRADDFFPGKNLCKIYFELEKGSYATTVLMEIMKTKNIA